MDMKEMAAMLVEAETAGSGAKWKKFDLPSSVTTPDPTARGFIGEAGGWSFWVVDFNVENQGFPAGTRGYDGTGVKSGTLLRLTRELAEKFFKAADAPA